MFTIKELLKHRMEYGEINRTVAKDACTMANNWSTAWWISLILLSVSFSLGVGLGLGGYKESFVGFSAFCMFCLYILVKANKAIRKYRLMEASYDRKDEIDKAIGV